MTLQSIQTLFFAAALALGVAAPLATACPGDDDDDKSFATACPGDDDDDKSVIGACPGDDDDDKSVIGRA